MRRMRLRIAHVTALAVLIGHPLMAQGPAWWTSRGVLTNSAASDYAPLLLGQLKWMATNAYDELNASLVPFGGAGTNVQDIVFALGATNNGLVANVGQLKAVAAPFHERLIAVGYSRPEPWTSGTTTDDVDRAVATLGQLKQVFAFDFAGDADSDGLADWLESNSRVFVSPYDPGTDPALTDTDHDGTADGAEVANRTDPNIDDIIAPSLTLTVIVPRWALP